MQLPLNRRLPILLLVLLYGPALAGEIPGLPAGLPPFIERDLELNFSNDFLGRGAATDDFRTQQTSLMARFGERWMGLVDHSILTLNDEIVPGRTDQLSVSVGYFLISDGHDKLTNSVAIGAGLRSTGNFSGEALQNGFHRLVDSGVVSLPYTDTGTIQPQRSGSMQNATGSFTSHPAADHLAAGGPDTGCVRTH